ncbi:hypothetical protein CW304_12155 [Bacillus sp. UFRGS-B20]|nr:hypothetical protein CW304_12155 [Bacillus sp. UFRGS-B20]
MSINSEYHHSEYNSVYPYHFSPSNKPLLSSRSAPLSKVLTRYINRSSFLCLIRIFMFFKLSPHSLNISKFFLWALAPPTLQ